MDFIFAVKLTLNLTFLFLFFQFCGPCLRNRYGEDAQAALKDPVSVELLTSLSKGVSVLILWILGT
jgi:hypothetical protein